MDSGQSDANEVTRDGLAGGRGADGAGARGPNGCIRRQHRDLNALPHASLKAAESEVSTVQISALCAQNVISATAYTCDHECFTSLDSALSVRERVCVE